MQLSGRTRLADSGLERLRTTERGRVELAERDVERPGSRPSGIGVEMQTRGLRERERVGRREDGPFTEAWRRNQTFEGSHSALSSYTQSEELLSS